jgi:hypothetical protein
MLHYFTLAGVVEDSDNVTEIHEIVDELFDAAVMAASEERGK